MKKANTRSRNSAPDSLHQVGKEAIELGKLLVEAVIDEKDVGIKNITTSFVGKLKFKDR